MVGLYHFREYWTYSFHIWMNLVDQQPRHCWSEVWRLSCNFKGSRIPIFLIKTIHLIHFLPQVVNTSWRHPLMDFETKIFKRFYSFQFRSAHLKVEILQVPKLLWTFLKQEILHIVEILANTIHLHQGAFNPLATRRVKSFVVHQNKITKSDVWFCSSIY